MDDDRPIVAKYITRRFVWKSLRLIVVDQFVRGRHHTRSDPALQESACRIENPVELQKGEISQSHLAYDGPQCCIKLPHMESDKEQAKEKTHT